MKETKNHLHHEKRLELSDEIIAAVISTLTIEQKIHLSKKLNHLASQEIGANKDFVESFLPK